MFRTIFLGVVLILGMPVKLLAQGGGDHFFEHSYAVVIGIDNYTDASRPKLAHAVKDAKAFATFLKGQGFSVVELYNQDATRAIILSTLEQWFVSIPTKEDRVLMFFAGHGETRSGARGDRGFLVPADGSDYPSLIPAMMLQQIVALHVNLDKTAELRKETFTA